MIFVAHAFHWFDIESTRNEFKRILKSDGKVFILARFLDVSDRISAEYISITRFGKRKNGFINNLEAYTDSRMEVFYGHPVEKHTICTENELHSLERLLAELKIRIDSSGDDTILNDSDVQKEIEKNMIDFFLRNHNSDGFVPLKYNTFYFFSELS